MLSAFLLNSCERLDPLSVTESHDGTAVIMDVLATRSGDRIICVSRTSSSRCTRENADVIVASVTKIEDVKVRWADYEPDVVTVSAARGEFVRSPNKALNGSVTIEYR